MKSIEQLLCEYQPDLFKLSKKPFVNENVVEYDDNKLYKGSCQGNYPENYYDYHYWYEVVRAEESEEE